MSKKIAKMDSAQLESLLDDYRGTFEDLSRSIAVTSLSSDTGSGGANIAMWPSASPPDQVRFLQVDFDTNGNKFECGIVAGGFSQVRSWSDASDEIWSYMQSNSFPQNGRTLVPNGANPRRLPLTHMSILAPIEFTKANRTIPYSAKCLYVIQLPDHPGNSGTDWRYSTKNPPISFGDKQLKVEWNNGANTASLFAEDYLFDLSFCVDPSVDPSPGHRRRSGEVFVRPKQSNVGDITSYKSTRWACFLFDFKKFLFDLRMSSPDATLNFALRYNLHLEVRDDINGHFIPIIIDPDIGHPGGNSPDP